VEYSFVSLIVTTLSLLSSFYINLMNFTPVLVGVIGPAALLLDAQSLKRCTALEIRYDLFPQSEWETLVERVRVLHPSAVVIGTIRMVGDGGNYPDNKLEERNELWAELLDYAQIPDWIDLEEQSLELTREVRLLALERKVQILVSCHDFQGIAPMDVLQQMVAKARRIKADGFKIAAMSKELGDCAPLYDLARQEHAGFTWFAAFAMAATGKASRLYSLVCGANLTYASLGDVVALGQIEAEQMENLLERVPRARSEQDVWAWLRAQDDIV
jgi:3-dehydroquinate dehydratase I